MSSSSSISLFPESLQAFLGSAEVYPSLDAVALRETSKFGERTNIHGLPIHPLKLPPDPDGLLETPGGLEDLPTDVYVKLREMIRAQPQILIQGSFAGSLGRPYAVAAFFPQSSAQLAQAWDQLLWRDDTPAHAPGLTVIHLPEFPQPIMLGLPDEGIALILGTDDPRPGLLVALEWANREWKAHQKLLELKKEDEPKEPAIMLPGGTFVIHGEDKSEAGQPEATPTLIFPGESVPVTWEQILQESLPELRACALEELLLAGAEPWCGLGGGLLAPFWRNPVLPASLLKHAPRWQETALHPDALPFGVAVNDRGAIDWEACDEAAFIIAPRHAIPSPFPANEAPVHPERHFTHRAQKPEAMELWALGFPSPEVLGPQGGH